MSRTSNLYLHFNGKTRFSKLWTYGDVYSHVIIIIMSWYCKLIPPASPTPCLHSSKYRNNTAMRQTFPLIMTARLFISPGRFTHIWWISLVVALPCLATGRSAATQFFLTCTATTVLDSVSRDQWAKALFLKLAPVSTQEKKNKQQVRSSSLDFPLCLYILIEIACKQAKPLAWWRKRKIKACTMPFIFVCLQSLFWLTLDQQVWPHSRENISLSVRCAVSDHQGAVSRWLDLFLQTCIL